MPSITAIIQDDQDQPLKGITVTLDGPTQADSPIPQRQETSNDGGKCIFTPLELGTYNLLFPGYSPVVSGKGFHVLPENEREQEIKLKATDPEPIADIRSYLPDPQPNSATTDANGVYKFEGLVEGDYLLRFPPEVPHPTAPVGDEVLLILEEGSPSEVEITIMADETVDDTKYAVSRGPVPPQLVIQKTIQIQQSWEQVRQRLNDLIAVKDFKDYAEQIRELVIISDAEVTWLKTIKDVRAGEASSLLRTLHFRVVEQSAIVQGRLEGLCTSIDNLSRSQAEELKGLREKLVEAKKLLVAINSVLRG
jgi:hypothetical protein